MNQKYNIIIVGAGHSGCEAAHAAAKLGSDVLLITMNMDAIAKMSCNPAMGGVAKGQIVREIDALGGRSGIVSDLSMIQFRMLNKSKGQAMWSPRTQNDRMRFSETWRLILEKNPKIDFWQGMVESLVFESGKLKGVKTMLGLVFYADAVILTNGTFLNGLIHIGEKKFSGGRVGELAAKGITKQLVDIGFKSGRMKTGTPPRVDGRSLDYRKMEEQKGDENPGKFSYSKQTSPLKKQRSCFITYTNTAVHDTLKEGFSRSPMFNGAIQSIGPRYCPSIEDKINRFSERNRHQIFVEPEGWNTIEIYVNGFSTSLPEDVQYKALKKVKGFENVKFFRPGYAIEYDFFSPMQLHLTLETKLIDNLYFAGQINGTTGYEEAACQGLMAGINAHLKINKEKPFVLSRTESYIGVLIDDLINKGTEEPYRMFTSRAEYRILLRQDNADIRLTKKGYDLGLVNNDDYQKVVEKEKQWESLKKEVCKIGLSPESVNTYLSEKKSSPIKQKTKLKQLIKRPNIVFFDLIERVPELKLLKKYSKAAIEQTEIELKYQTYIEKEQLLVGKINALENYILKENLNYSLIKALSSEAKEKLQKIQPKTIGQASRISGVSPADISVLMVYLGK